MKRVLSLLLCIIMVLSCLIPSAVFADTANEEITTKLTENIGTAEPTRGAEITSMREKNAKTYEMSDGTYQCVVYAEDIHYEDSRGALQDIDNSIKNTTTKSGYSLTNTANSWHTYFADKLSQDNAVSIEKDNYSVSFSLPSLTLSSEGSSLRDPITASNVKIATQLTAAEKAVSPYYSNLAEDNRAVLYKDVLQDVDISYTVKTGHLKEDIIIKSASAPKEFEFKLNMVGVTPEQVDGTLIFINSKGETIFELAPMYMEDANGKYSDKITYSLSQDKEGYKLKITADPNFFLDSKTVYPVVIDPTTMVTGESKTYDTCADQQYPTKNYYLSENLWTGGKSGTNAMRTYIRFDLPVNIASGSITSAYLRIKKREHQAPTIKGYRIVNQWSSSGVTWNNQPGYNSSYATGTAALDTGAWYKLNATTMVKAWRAGTYSNYGFILKEPSESSTSQKTKFYSSDAPSPNKPELVINYTTSDLYIVSYNANGGTGTAPSSHTNIIAGNSIQAETNTFSRTGYTFSSWNTKPDATGTNVQPLASYTPTSNTVLYAKWTGKVTYKANGGSGTAPSAQTFIAGKSITAKANTFTKSGYDFICWNTKSDGTGKDVYAGETYKPSGTTSLYAKWAKRYNMSVYYTPGIDSTKIADMNTAINTVVNKYLEYGIHIVPSSATAHEDLEYRTLTIACKATDSDNGCPIGCGLTNECKTKHHRNNYYYLNKLKSSTSQRVVRIVDWVLCDEDDWSDGYTNKIDGKDMVCNVNKDDLNYLIMHELAHTFGLKDGYDGSEPNCLGKCVMKGRPSINFCNYCKTLLPN